jgi:hypothetical protein
MAKSGDDVGAQGHSPRELQGGLSACLVNITREPSVATGKRVMDAQ